jgi:hypothetical protein
MLGVREHTCLQFLLDSTPPLLVGKASSTRGSGREVRCPDIDSIGVKRPIIQVLRPAERLLGRLRCLILVGRVYFEGTLADLAVTAIISEHVLHESNNKPGHRSLLEMMECWDNAKAANPVYNASAEGVVDSCAA